jgi:1-phosphofructokinase family hexose kinase
MNMSKQNIVTVCLNPAVDKTIMVKQLQPGAHQMCEKVLRSQGGKGINVSRTLSSMGIANIATGFLGNRNINEFNDFLNHPLVDNKFVVLDGSTRENITIVDTTAQVDTHIRDKGLPVDVDGLKKLDQIFTTLPTGSMIVFSGSLSPGIQFSAFGDMLKKCADYGLTVVADVSGKALKTANSEKLFLIKPNIEELSELVGRPLKNQSELIETVRQDCSNVENVLVSMGAQGAMLVGQSEILTAHCSSCDMRPINTVGCGDVLLGTFIGMLSKENNFEYCLKRAVANASACAFHPVPTVFDQDLAEKLYKNIHIEINSD